MIGPLPAQLTGTGIGPSDLQRCAALGRDERRPQCHLQVEFELITLVPGGQVGNSSSPCASCATASIMAERAIAPTSSPVPIRDPFLNKTRRVHWWARSSG